jgi:hypothetical protein
MNMWTKKLITLNYHSKRQHFSVERVKRIFNAFLSLFFAFLSLFHKLIQTLFSPLLSFTFSFRIVGKLWTFNIFFLMLNIFHSFLIFNFLLSLIIRFGSLVYYELCFNCFCKLISRSNLTPLEWVIAIFVNKFCISKKCKGWNISIGLIINQD